jgi:FkbM family methyltransferase
MIDLSNFNWGWMDDPTDVYQIINEEINKPIGQYHKDSIIQEIFHDKLYEKLFEVEPGDIVVDVGSSIGPFSYSILHKNPKHVFCLEPSIKEFKTLNKNLRGYPITTINKGISDINSVVKSNVLFGGESEMETLKFDTFLDLYSIDKIDFLKTDCEGGEYDIFNEENKKFILDNVKKIAGEWHLGNYELKEKFRKFRDTYLTKFDNFNIFSVDGHPIKWDLWNEHFIEYYTEVIINIDNR